MPADQPPAIEAIGVTRTFGKGPQQLPALRDVSLVVGRGETVAIMGPSGSGKSTLLFILAGLDLADGGSVQLAGTDWQSLQGRARAQFRRRNCGFISQGLSLLPQATAAENVEVPLLLDGVPARDRPEIVRAALDQVGLARHASQLVDQLSGGEQQRVAIARALVLNPAVVLADEPTGSLDSANGQLITRLLIAAARQRDASVVIVTHDPEVAHHAERTVHMHSGMLQ